MKESALSAIRSEMQSPETVYGMPAHKDRTAAVNEVHARPHLLITSPQTLLQFAFMTKGDQSGDQRVMVELSDRLGLTPSENSAPLHGITWREGALYCEKHGEFSTYLWSTTCDPRDGQLRGENPFRHGFTPPGSVICGTRLDILPWTAESEAAVTNLDPVSRCYSVTENGRAAIISDFRQDKDGLTRILILERDLTEAQLGALVQRLLEIENYRTLALLSLPLTRTMASELRRVENRLAEITEEMRTGEHRKNEQLLSALTNLAAELEAGAAANLYRFGASQAYYEIVEERLNTLSETPVPGYYTWSDFLQRRIAPAMRTCRSVKERQAKLSDKLMRAISLLRSWIDVELEHQNRDLLASMNNRARQQLHLQQTVEGLSVAAISYYVVSLISYLVKGVPGIHDVMPPELAVAILVPFIVLAIWWVVRRIRNSHTDPEHNENRSD
ncbi:TPA: DUF3422 family protein [Klebsiella quasipneumoniae subsp. quasipneumoniae]|jgi:uncharacterized membrane-anchored protein|uniref:DUF3422 family protein n=19 Tax=Gammaproteobacteria TaxID=1236 RepID=A0A501WJ31_9GAMM|nr:MULTISPECIES: DUF3422 family protein [Gammaproteobacteria]EAA1316163.1 DUF3422 domain-containing protein [Salmonella enterica subsp. enterica serovar Java]EAA7802062.1 DUF3422 family protein [Salmonella enterica subsp. enterica serovar Heidelberg]EAW1359813.1 DUF3422 family protein [Salmonella enterica subsp. enterica]EBF6821874.1 DUF3422 family protein [Salmonella enterica subsp. enterica serovar Mbandaka]EBW8693294.1 DUF3422 family protein [Salmonella enterica subsp. enterica serovar Adel